MATRHFLTLLDFTPAELDALLDRASELKRSITAAPETSSKFPVGSSASKTLGWLRSARATAKR